MQQGSLEPRDPHPKSSRAWRTMVLMLLAIGCGCLVYNFHTIITTSHFHISLAHQHKSTAFCAFLGSRCKDGG